MSGNARGYDFMNIPDGMEFVTNIQIESGGVKQYEAQGCIIGDPQPTCTAYPTTQKAKDSGFVGVYRKVV